MILATNISLPRARSRAGLEAAPRSGSKAFAQLESLEHDFRILFLEPQTLQSTQTPQTCETNRCDREQSNRDRPCEDGRVAECRLLHQGSRVAEVGERGEVQRPEGAHL